MSRALSTLLTLTALLATALPVAANEPASLKGASPAAATAATVPGEVVVKFRDGKRGPDVAGARGLVVLSQLDVPGKGMAAVLSTGGRPVDAVVAELAADPAVEYAEPNYLFSIAAPVSVNDPQTGGQYSLDRMKVRHAWGRSTGASNVVAVLDTGVQAGHPDLKGRVLKGYDFVNNDTGAADDNGHGTWVAGIIAANANDGYGIAGISWTDKILPVKIMNSSGTGSTSDLTSGIVWAANKGADIINMSVGGFPYSQAVEDAVNYAWGKGAVLVGAAGNNGRLEDFYPASYANVVSVSATQVDDEFSHWSSYGPKVDVSAPGSSVLTTNCTASACPNRGWGSHTYISGTSFATPNVAGVLALIKARYPEQSPSQIVARLYATVDDLGYSGREDRYGRGRVNAFRALGGSIAQPGTLAGDAFEGNNGMSAAVPIPRGSTTSPTMYPAGDVDWFSVRAPRAGRLEVRVGGVVDTRAYPWNRSSLPVDPIVELYTLSGTLLVRVDNVWESGTELAQVTVSGPTRILVRITNYYANGSRTAYSVTPRFVDTVAPIATVTRPLPDATDVTQWIAPKAHFDEAVKNVSSTTALLRDTTTDSLVPATVAYDSSRREATITPSNRLDGNRTYRIELTAGITDVAGNPLSATAATFTTSLYAFGDIQGTKYAQQIQWLADRKMVRGCGKQLYCPTDKMTRGSTATFLAWTLKLPSTKIDFFTDDNASRDHGAINRVAAARVMTGCTATKFCPDRVVKRGQMASLLADAFDLPPATKDYFPDDDESVHEDAINRVAEAGVMKGCGKGNFCPGWAVRRDVMADHLYRALNR